MPKKPVPKKSKKSKIMKNKFNKKKKNDLKPIDMSKVLDQQVMRASGSTSTTSIGAFVSSFMPDTMPAVLKYSDNGFLYNGTVNWTIRQWSGNGLFDPDISGVGHQPRGYDELSAIYGKYIVYASKIYLFGTNRSTTEQVQFGVWPAVGTPALTEDYDFYEKQYLRSALVGVSTSGNAQKNLRLYATTKSVKGFRKLGPQDASYVGASGNSGSNPGDTWIWAVAANSIVDGEYNFNIHTVIKYYCMFFDRKTVPAS